MIFLLVGIRSPAKDQSVQQLKEKNFTSTDAIRFDFDLIDGVKVDASSLKQSLIALPAIAKKRLVLIRDAHKLSAQNKELIVSFAKEKNDQTDVILDWSADDAPQGFVNSLGTAAKITRFAKEKELNAFDLTRLIPTDPAAALRSLNELYESGEHPLQILGVIVWFWGKSKNQLSKENFTKGLRELQEADLNIKRSKLRPQQAVEVLVVKLSALFAR